MSKKTAIEKLSQDHLDRLESSHDGDIYFSKTYMTFYRIDKILKNGNVRVSESRDGEHWKKSSRQSLREIREYCHKLPIETGESVKDAIQSLEKEMLAAFLDPSILNNKEDGENSSTALVVTGGMNMYKALAEQTYRLQQRARIISELAESRLKQLHRYEMAMREKMEKVMRVIGILEAYLGVHEQIFQLTKGEPAAKDTPISIRQLMLYMDEEAAVFKVYHGRKGTEIWDDINFQNVDKFDAWLLQDNHLDIVLPEKKGIVALRPSRQNRYGHLDPWEKSESEEQDRMVYLLIRNGENLYRVWTPLILQSTFFPTKQDSEKMEKLLMDDWSSRRDGGEKEKSKWITNVLLVQGLIDRTEIFHPLPNGRIDLTDMNTYSDNGLVNLIRDAEDLLTDGHISFGEWMQQINEKISRGTRIFFRGLEWDRDGHGDRFDVYRNWYPHIPVPDIYTVESIKHGKYSKTIKFLYMPSDDVYHRDEFESRPRRKRMGFNVHFDEVINYDEMDIPNIDYFLQSRAERRSYRRILPTLIELRAKRLAEIQQENDFAKLLSSKHGIPLAKIEKMIEWWKMKVINKRPISQDDAKAWRMIIKEARKRK